jgi:hypothetical protein
MANYKVSYKVLRQQGEDIKAIAKLVDGYAERVGQIRGKLGDDGLLAEVRSNLQKLQAQLGESRTVLNTSGEFLVKTVESYSGVETRQVKKVDGTKAHNRDFYKNPVAVASVGGAAGGAAAMGATGGTAAMDATGGAAAMDATATTPIESANTQALSSPVATEAADVSPVASTAPDAQPSGSNTQDVAAGSVLGAAAGAGSAAGGLHMKKKRDAEKAIAANESSGNEYDPEGKLEKAIARVRELEGKP